MSTIRCPICEKQFDPAATLAMPFCSDRCKNVDFGAWATESYRLDAKPPAPEDDDPDAAFASDR